MRGGAESFRANKIHAFRHSKEIGPADLVLIALKTTHNEALRKLIPPLLHQTTILLTLQNGLGNEEFLAKQFGAERVIGGLCFICLNRVAPGVIDNLDRGHLRLGEFGGSPLARTRAIGAAFQDCGVECKVVDDLMRERWRKLVWNIPFNGLAVISGGITTADILRDQSLRQATLELMEEVITAANAVGHDLPRAIVEEQIDRTQEMGAYKPSTLIDFEAGRPLELEAIWGVPLRQATAAGANLPRWADLYARLKALTK